MFYASNPDDFGIHPGYMFAEKCNFEKRIFIKLLRITLEFFTKYLAFFTFSVILYTKFITRYNFEFILWLVTSKAERRE